METKASNYIALKDLEVYRLSRDLSKIAWQMYQNFSYEDKKLHGDQFVRATDSVGANIAEGYHRFHFRDKIRFYYISRGSLSEASVHWLELLQERNRIDSISCERYAALSKKLEIKLNNFIAVTYKQIKNGKK